MTNEQPAAFCETWEQIKAYIQESIKGIVILYNRIHRWALYIRLVGYHIPDSLAWFLAQRWPTRWLPRLTSRELDL